MGDDAREIVLIKLGGSLITDKQRPETARLDVIGRLAAEVAELAAERPGQLLLGHGSGSFGHVAARRHGIHTGIESPAQLAGIGLTQEQAARLHRLVVGELLTHGAAAWSFAPSSALLFDGGEPAEAAIAPLVRALELGLLPVTYGDVVLDRRQGSAICSTEALFEVLAARLGAAGFSIRRALWLGETDGIWGADGRRVESFETARQAEPLLTSLGGASGPDVTGGVRLRVESALRLARRGITSSILDGREPGILRRALAGEEVGGTRVPGTADPSG